MTKSKFPAGPRQGRQNNSKYQISNAKTAIFSFIFCALTLFCYLSFDICHLVFAQDKIIAVVNNDVITKKDLDDFVNFMRIQLSQEYQLEALERKINSIKLDLLDRLIEDRLILQQAKKNNIKADDARIKGKIDEIKRRYPAEQDFKETLDRQGLVLADLEDKIREQLLMYNIIESKIKSKIVVSPSEVTEFYQKNNEHFKSLEERVIEALNSPDENIIQDISDELISGQPFQSLAQKYSLSLNKINTAADGQLRKEIQDVVVKLSPGETSKPVKIENNYYIFKVINLIPSSKESLAQAQDKIYNLLFDKKMQEELTRWLNELKKHSYIKISAD